MTETKPTFWKRLSDSQLLSPTQLAAAEGEVEQTVGEVTKSEPRPLAKALIRAGLITPFQAKALLKGVRLPLVWNDYRIIDRIEGGVFARCYEVTHIPTGHKLALRLLSKDDWPSVLSVDQVRLNIQNYRAAKSSQLARTYELLEEDKYYGFIMDIVVGQRLSDRLEEQNKLTTPEASTCIFQVCQGLMSLHEQQLVHADLRPESIFETQDGTTLLWRDPLYVPASFYTASGPTLTDLYERSAYLAPELSVLQSDYNVLTDVYALGGLFYRLLAGRAAFDGQTLSEVMKRHSEEKLVSLSNIGVESAIDQIITYMMAKRPDIRYQNVESVADQISQFVGNQISLAPPPPPSETQVEYEKWIQARSRLVELPVSNPSQVGATPALMVGDNSKPMPHNSPARFIQARQQAKRRQKVIGLVIAGVLVIGGIAGGIGFLLSGGSSGTGNIAQSDDEPDVEGNNETDNTPPVAQYDPDAVTPQVLIEDDGQSLWESPTQGTALDFKQVPNSPRLLITIRPSDLLKAPEGALLFNALGPAFSDATNEWQALTGIDLERIQSLTISLHDAAAGQAGYRACYRVELTDAEPESTLITSWKNQSGAGDVQDGVLETDSQSYWLAEKTDDPSSSVSVFVVGPADLVSQAQQNTDKLPTMQPDLRRIMQTVDTDRHLNLIFLSTNLSNPSSQAWMQGAWQPLWQPLQPVLMGGIQAGCLSVHVDEDLFVEFVAKGQISQSPAQLAGYLEGALPTWQSQIERGVASLPSNPYWEQVRLRYVTWVREGFLLSRVGVESNLAKINAWLPGPAAHNLVAGTELALSTIAGPVTESKVVDNEGPLPQNMAELLQQNVDFSVSSNDMINVMGDLQISISDRFKSLPFDFEIRLMGGDLREEGITQNQRISNFEMNDQPLADVLTGLVVAANPDKASESPADERQKLLWVAVPDPDDKTRTVILITTRKAALRNSHPLPEVFGGSAS